MKIGKRIVAVGLSMFIMGGLFVWFIKPITQITEVPITISSIDPPTH